PVTTFKRGPHMLRSTSGMKLHQNRCAPAFIEPMEPRRLLSTAGKLDTSFSGDGIAPVVGSSEFLDVAVQSDEKVVAVGFRFGTNGSKLVRARYRSDGSIDSGFGTNGRTTLGDNTQGVELVIAGDGKILVAGGDNHVYRFTSSGKLDKTFSGDGIAD